MYCSYYRRTTIVLHTMLTCPQTVKSHRHTRESHHQLQLTQPVVFSVTDPSELVKLEGLEALLSGSTLPR